VFTTNQVIAAPCVVTRRHLERGTLRAIVVNSGNANACTGEQGERHAVTMARAAAQRVGCDPYEVAVASTGVIGVPLPVERIAKAVKQMGLRPAAWIDVAKAIMTTDTKPKLTGIELPLGAGTVHLRGIAKGAGMIHPNLATLLAFVMSDADVGADDLRSIAREAADALLEDALALERAGVFSIVLEGIPLELGTEVSRALTIPTIGIGAGPGCDGQVLVLHDLIGLSFGKPAKFVRRYADVAGAMRQALTAFKDDVRSGRYPEAAESYAAAPERDPCAS